jgi:hypothetical protein
VLNQSEYFKQKEGSSSKFKDPHHFYRNDLPPEDPANVETISKLLEVVPELEEEYGISPLLNSQVLFLKVSIVSNLLKAPFDISKTEDLRNKYFITVEEGLRKVISLVQSEEKVAELNTKIRALQNTHNKDARTGKYLEFLQRKLKKALDFQSEEGQDPHQIPRSKFDNLDEELPHAFRRS